MINDDELGARLTKLDRAQSVIATDESLDELLHKITIPAKRRANHLKLVSGLAVGGLLVIGVGVLPAAAAVRAFLAQVVEEPPGGGTEVIPESDWIDTGAGDIREFVASRYPDALPLPRGVARNDVIDTVAFSISRTAGIRQTTGVDRAYESYIYCRWVDVWLTSDAVGDGAGKNYAANIMHDAATWPATVAGDGGGVVEQQTKFATSAESGDSLGVQDAFDSNGCPGWKSLGSTQ